MKKITASQSSALRPAALLTSLSLALLSACGPAGSDTSTTRSSSPAADAMGNTTPSAYTIAAQQQVRDTARCHDGVSGVVGGCGTVA